MVHLISQKRLSFHSFQEFLAIPNANFSLDNNYPGVFFTVNYLGLFLLFEVSCYEIFCYTVVPNNFVKMGFSVSVVITSRVQTYILRSTASPKIRGLCIVTFIT